MSNGDEEARQVAVQWAEAYFNCDYHEALRLSTAESDKWLRFTATNTTTNDLRLIQESPAIVVHKELYTSSDDTLWVWKLTMNNTLSPIIPGDTVHLEKNLTFLITVVKRDNTCLVKMEGLPQSERQSHD